MALSEEDFIETYAAAIYSISYKADVFAQKNIEYLSKALNNE